jgi:hypothetical protein
MEVVPDVNRVEEGLTWHWWLRPQDWKGVALGDLQGASGQAHPLTSLEYMATVAFPVSGARCVARHMKQGETASRDTASRLA